MYKQGKLVLSEERARKQCFSVVSASVPVSRILPGLLLDDWLAVLASQTLASPSWFWSVFYQSLRKGLRSCRPSTGQVQRCQGQVPGHFMGQFEIGRGLRMAETVLELEPGDTGRSP